MATVTNMAGGTALGVWGATGCSLCIYIYYISSWPLIHQKDMYHANSKSYW